MSAPDWMNIVNWQRARKSAVEEDFAWNIRCMDAPNWPKNCVVEEKFG
jgi:hypothetical protein